MTDIPLSVPNEFPAFPYDVPYAIQTDLMRHLYAAIEKRQLAIVESPTGTGKTLSLLTSSLSWLHDNKDRVKKVTLDSLRGSLNTADDPDWVVDQTFDRLKKELDLEELAFEQHLAGIRAREQSSRRGFARVTKRPRLSNSEANVSLESDDDLLLPEDERHEEQELSFDGQEAERLLRAGASRSPTKIFFASRTHSQLSQVMRELLQLRSVCSASVYPANEHGGHNDLKESSTPLPRSVSLASRSHLCINEQLRVKTTDLDEGCRELLTSGCCSKIQKRELSIQKLDRRGDRCPYLPPLGEEHRLYDLRDRILAFPKDIEDVVLAGKELKLCPYFSSRAALPSAELVTLPYSLLLHKRSRQVLDINTKDHVIVIDEAHNLIDTLLQLHTIELSTAMLQLANKQLAEYLSRFRSRLTTTHAVHLKRLIHFLQALERFAHEQSDPIHQTPEHGKVMTVSVFVDSMGSKVNGINVFELQSYLVESKLARKVSRYAEKTLESSEVWDGKRNANTVLPLHAIESFIAGLTNDVEDGIIAMSADRRCPGEVQIKYQHLNPATYFEEIVHDARCVILAGGTMSPISDVSLQLFPTVSNERISIFSCGHVVPRSNLLCVVIGKGPRGKSLEFKFKNREDESLMDELGQCLFNTVNVCPDGIVAFFPSYSFLDKAKLRWSSNGLLKRIQRKKQIFYEPQESAEVDGVLREYTIVCRQISGTTKGALLLAVVGAKLSEGLNFTDELARAVVLVGIPYPNLASPELKERMKYVSRRMEKLHDAEKKRDAGNEMYENLAMRAVNQSIGRAIRHQNDWAALILIDNRYESQKVQAKLPNWIRQSIITSQSFGQAMKLLGDFYREKRT